MSNNNGKKEVVEEKKLGAPRGRSGSKTSKSVATWQVRFYNLVRKSYEDKSYKDKYWTINELTSLIHDDEFVTPKKKGQAYAVIYKMRQALFDEFQIDFMSVPGKGYAILTKKEDYIRVAKNRISTISSATRTVKHIAVEGKIQEILLSMVKPSQMADAKKILSLM